MMITEIKVGDYIEKSELDTEQKYNDVVEVFGQWGASFRGSAVSEYSHFEDDNSLGFCKSGLFQLYSDNTDKKRKLTYNDIMSLKKVDWSKADKARDKLKEIVNKAKSEMEKDAKPYEFNEPVSVQYLNRCKAVQFERGK